MNKTLFFIPLILLTLLSCGNVKQLSTVKTEYITVKDSVWVKDTVIKVTPPVEVYRDYVDVSDTLVLRGELNIARAWVDTTKRVLNGEMKSTGKQLEKVVYIKGKTVYRDTTITKEIPVEVEKVIVDHKMNWFQKIFFWLGIALAVYGLIKLLLFFFGGTSFNILGKVIKI